MKSSDQEPLFTIEEPDSPDASQPSAASHIDIARTASRPDEAISDELLEATAEKLGSYFLARAALGLPLEEDEKPPTGKPLPGKPLSFPKPGYVRDSHDGGRADEFRGGYGAPEIDSEAHDTLRQKLPELQSLRDRLVEDNIRNDFEEDVIASEYVKVDEARSRAVSRYRAHIQRHYPDWDSDDVRELLADFSETLLPPSPLQ